MNRLSPVHWTNLAMNFFDCHPKKTIFFLLLFFIVILESAVSQLAKQGMISLPVHRTTREPVFMADHPVLGVWHLPNATYHQKLACKEATYRSNSYGARDKDRSQEGTGRRVALLGDSFVEGFGVEAPFRLGDVLEEETGVEFLNFGSGGDFGPVQEWLQYRDMVRPFQHSDVVLMFLPDNDFTDVDPAHFPKNKYRPYLRKTDGSFELYYTTEFNQKSDKSESIKIINNIISNHFAIYNLVRESIKHAKKASKAKKDPNFVPYDDFSDTNKEMVEEALKRLLELAADKKVTFFIIPRHRDLMAAVEGRLQNKVLPFLDGLKKYHKNLEVYDLLPAYLADMKQAKHTVADYFLPCDGHWNELGNHVAAMHVKEKLF
ncbi:MAG: SGNH/GDSL hydrolase family protein [Magnetococcales bacterium]|nr:SGNH/GDSL hydrolase family protein [Magnetococcales bacterium]